MWVSSRGFHNGLRELKLESARNQKREAVLFRECCAGTGESMEAACMLLCTWGSCAARHLPSVLRRHGLLGFGFAR